MKLTDHLILRITLFFTPVMFFWGAVYLFLQMQEIHDGNDEGLTNLKQEFIAKANASPGFVETLKCHAPLNLIIEEIPREEAERITEHFVTTRIYFPTELEEEEVRMLITAFRCEPDGKYYRLQCFTSTVETDDLIKNMIYLLLALWSALTLTLIVVSRIVISRANKPFYLMLDELKKFRPDNSQPPSLPSANIREYAKLAESLNGLLRRNISVFTEQKTFIENVSHELQTPLAVVVAKLESLLQKYSGDRHFVTEIAAALGTLNRMKRLNSTLLLLSKIKNRQFTEASPVRLRDTLDAILADFADLIAYRQISITVEGDASPVFTMNDDLAHILFLNLVKNSVAHGEVGGKLIVRFDENSVTIANTGTEEAKNVFSRYNRRAEAGDAVGADDATDAKRHTNSGLGLSIVKAITDLYGIHVTYRFEDSLHFFLVIQN
jgi:signal transduction histidine kinase